MYKPSHYTQHRGINTKKNTEKKQQKKQKKGEGTTKKKQVEVPKHKLAKYTIEKSETA
jgi:hypothetical protein